MRYPALTRILAADPKGPQLPAEADLDPQVDLNQFHMHIKVAIDEIDKAMNQIKGHDPENDEIQALQECKEWLETMGAAPPPEGQKIKKPVDDSHLFEETNWG